VYWDGEMTWPILNQVGPTFAGCEGANAGDPEVISTVNRTAQTSLPAC
jgi:hypothetical protein